MPNSSSARLQSAFSAPRATRLWRALAPLKSVVNFMNTGAHPDDEISKMLAALTFRDGINLSHACSTRGEGGQNAIGTQTGVSLGVVRTREMERAADVLNMRQYWLCQYPSDPLADFGFSKSGDETLRIWGEERTLERFVHIIRSERPDIISPTFLDVPGQHGHHRAMTQSAFKAVKMAADPKAFPDQQLQPWQVKKIYLPAWSGAGDAYDDDLPPPQETVRVNGNGVDVVFGMSYAQIGEVSRSFHKTQGMGHWVERDADFQWPLNLAWAASGFEDVESAITDRLPNNLSELASFSGASDIEEFLCAAQDSIDQAISSWPQSAEVATQAASALEHIRRAQKECPEAAIDEVAHRLAIKELQLSNVIYLASDIDARFDLSHDEARPGDEVAARIHVSGGLKIKTEIVAPKDWSVLVSDEDKAVIVVPEDAEPSDPLPDTWFPFSPNSDLILRLSFDCEGVGITHDVAPETRLNIVPAREYFVEPNALILNSNVVTEKQLRIVGLAQNEEVDLAGLSEFNSTTKDSAIVLRAAAQSKSGLTTVPLRIADTPAINVERMSFPHTGKLTFARPISVNILTLDVSFSDAPVGYIGGGSDVCDIWLREMGMNVQTIEDEQLVRGDFSGFGSILVGVFAFRTRAVLSENLSALHDWVRAGGNLVTLYHRPWDNWDVEKTPLAPITIGKPSLRWRVTDQNADVHTLDQNHELLGKPNAINKDDWSGWHKERGLYFASDWDDRYTPLLAMSDEGEAPLNGALLTGRFGKGRHTHTSLILHHQLAQLVPGAFRLMANLLHPL